MLAECEVYDVFPTLHPQIPKFGCTLEPTIKGRGRAGERPGLFVTGQRKFPTSGKLGLQSWRLNGGCFFLFTPRAELNPVPLPAPTSKSNSTHIPHSAAALHFNTHLTPRKVKELYFLQIKTIDFIYF